MDNILLDMLRIVPYLIMLQIDCLTEKEIEVKVFTSSPLLPFTVDSVSQWVPPVESFDLWLEEYCWKAGVFFENYVQKYERWYIEISQIERRIVRKKLFGTSKALDGFHFCQHFPMPTQNKQIWVCMYYVYDVTPSDTVDLMQIV